MIALTHLMLAAKSFGVDSCPMEGFVTAQVKSAFDIPEAIDLNQVCYQELYNQAFQL